MSKVLFRRATTHKFDMTSGGYMLSNLIPTRYLMPIWEADRIAGRDYLYPIFQAYIDDIPLSFFGSYSEVPLMDDGVYLVMTPFEEGEYASDIFNEDFTLKAGHRFYGAMTATSVIAMDSNVITGTLKDGMSDNNVEIFYPNDTIMVARLRLITSGENSGKYETIDRFVSTIDTVTNTLGDIELVLQEYPPIDIDVTGTDDFIVVSSVVVKHDDAVNKLSRIVELVNGSDTKLLVENITTNGNGIINKDWLITFTTDTDFTVVADGVTGLTSGNINTAYSPTNPIINLPYFTIPTTAWVSPVSGDTFTIRTIPAVSGIFVLIKHLSVPDQSGQTGGALPVAINAFIS
jgi:hypothetical protein